MVVQSTTLYAEDSPYWDTTVHPAKSQAEIIELLEAFGAESIMTISGISQGRHAWLVRFQWMRRNYRFAFTPKECRYPSKTSRFGGKPRIHSEQARYQMGRTAAWFIKAILTAASENKDAIFGFLELPYAASQSGSMPPTAAELDIRRLADAVPLLPNITILLSEDYDPDPLPV